MNGESTTADSTGFHEATFQGLLEDVGSDQLPVVLGLFVDELSRRTVDLQWAREVVAVDALRRAAHGIKGSASTFGAHRLAAAARRLEEDCRADRPGDELVAACDELLAEVNKAADWVRQRLAGGRGMK